MDQLSFRELVLFMHLVTRQHADPAQKQSLNKLPALLKMRLGERLFEEIFVDTDGVHSSLWSLYEHQCIEMHSAYVEPLEDGLLVAKQCRLYELMSATCRLIEAMDA